MRLKRWNVAAESGFPERGGTGPRGRSSRILWHEEQKTRGEESCRMEGQDLSWTELGKRRVTGFQRRRMGSRAGRN